MKALLHKLDHAFWLGLGLLQLAALVLALRNEHWWLAALDAGLLICLPTLRAAARYRE